MAPKVLTSPEISIAAVTYRTVSRIRESCEACKVCAATEVDRFIERFAAALVDGGMPRQPARAFGALLASDTVR